MTVKHIEIHVDEGEYKELKKVKDRYSLTWAGMLKRGNISSENIQKPTLKQKVKRWFT